MFIMIWGPWISIMLIRLGILARSLWLLQQYLLYMISIQNRCIINLHISYSKKMNFISRMSAYCTALFSFFAEKNSSFCRFVSSSHLELDSTKKIVTFRCLLSKKQVIKCLLKCGKFSYIIFINFFEMLQRLSGLYQDLMLAE